jgi:hypothetical protein
MNKRVPCAGFTLVEALLSVAFLGLVGVSIGAVYSSGNRSTDFKRDRMHLDMKLRGRMEVLIHEDFNTISGNSDFVSISGTTFQLVWDVVPVDLDGDSLPEPTAKQLTVFVSGLSDYSLTTIRVDNEDKVGKIP